MTTTIPGRRLHGRADDRDAERPVRLRPVATRRRPVVAVASALLVALCAAVVATEFAGAGHTVAVLAVSHPLEAGAVIEAGDLRAVQVHVPRSVAVVLASTEGAVVGRQAAAHLAGGTLLAPGDVVVAYAPPPGEALVGVALAPGQVPAGGVVPGQQVDVVVTAPSGSPSSVASENPAAPSPGTVEVTGAAVVAVEAPPASSGAATTVVSVAVPVVDAPLVAELSAAQQAALVVVPAAP